MTDKKVKIPYCLEKFFSGYEDLKRQLIIKNAYLERLWYDLASVKGIDYSKEKAAFNKDLQIERYYALSDQIAKTEEEIELLKICSGSLDLCLSRIKDKELKEAIKQRFIDTGGL